MALKMVWCWIMVLLAWGVPGLAALPSVMGAPSARGGKIDPTGLDVVILIDQSGSMWGHPEYHPEKNDRWNHRIGSTKNIILRLAEAVEGSPRVNRVAVINFDDRARVTLPIFEMRHQPADPGATLRETKTTIESRVVSEEGVNTNTPEAMALGLAELRNMAAMAPKEGRRRIMLIITDGRANLPPASHEVMRDRVSKRAEEVKREHVEIWVVGLNDADRYWNEGDGAFWSMLAGPGRARLAETAEAHIPTVFQDIVNDWLKMESVSLAEDEYQGLPYLRQLAFNVNFGRPRGEIRILDPEGQKVPLSSGGKASTPGTFARLVKSDPPPGIYRIIKNPSRSYSIQVEEYAANIRRLSPGLKGNLDQETRIVFQLTTDQGQPLALLPRHPLTVSVVIKSPSGAEEEVPTAFQGGGKFEARWKPTETGIYRLRLKGNIRQGDADVDVLAKNPREYEERLEISRRTPLSLSLISPDPMGSIPVYPWKESACSLEVNLVDAKGEAVTNMDYLVRDPATWLTVQLLDRNGKPTGEPLLLKPQAGGKFAATAPLSLNWLSGEGWWVPGVLNFRLAAQPDRLSDEYFLNALKLPPEAEAKRPAGDLFAVGPLEVRLPWWFLVAALLGALLLLGGGAAVLAFKVGPTLVIRREDARHPGTPEIWIYNPIRDGVGHNALKFPVGRKKHFYFDKKVVLDIGGREFVARKFRVVRLSSRDEALATVRYRWQDQNEDYTVYLEAGGRVEPLEGLPGDVSQVFALRYS